jgi:hypothetical protein
MTVPIFTNVGLVGMVRFKVFSHVVWGSNPLKTWLLARLFCLLKIIGFSRRPSLRPDPHSKFKGFLGIKKRVRFLFLYLFL